MWCSSARAPHRPCPDGLLYVRHQVPSTRVYPGSASGAWGSRWRFPWLHPFPPPPPLGRHFGYSLCSMASSVLRALTLAVATAHRRGRQGYGFAPCLSRPRLAARAPMRSPSFRENKLPNMLRVSDCAGSDHVLRLTTCSVLPSGIATPWASRLNDFAALWLACWSPLSTLRPTPRDVQRMTRGLSDSPFLPSIELSSTTIYQLLLAHCYFFDSL